MAAQVPLLQLSPLLIYWDYWSLVSFTMDVMLQVALKRQQAAEDAIALGLRAVATGDHRSALPQGPIVGRDRLLNISLRHNFFLTQGCPQTIRVVKLTLIEGFEVCALIDFSAIKLLQNSFCKSFYLTCRGGGVLSTEAGSLHGRQSLFNL